MTEKVKPTRRFVMRLIRDELLTIETRMGRVAGLLEDLEGADE